MDKTRVDTCPACGALVVPQLARCRRCRHYLHGTALEGWLFEHLLPERLQASPGTGLLVLLIGAYYLLQLVLTVPTDPASLFAFSRFSLVQLGATEGGAQLVGQHWRYVTSVFAHHDLMHVGFNVLSLTVAGPVVEQLYDRKKMLLMYLASGVGSMIVSFVWYVFVRGDVAFVSAGASGAVSGLVGAAWMGAHRLGPDGRAVAAHMRSWAIYLAVWGVAAPGINNAAHLGGFLIAGGLARAIPLGLTTGRVARLVSSGLLVGALVLVVGSVGAMLATLRGFPATLSADAYGRSILGFTVSEGVGIDGSTQAQVWRRAHEAMASGAGSDEADRATELNVRVNGHAPGAWLLRAIARASRGAPDAALHLAVARRLAHEPPGDPVRDVEALRGGFERRGADPFEGAFDGPIDATDDDPERSSDDVATGTGTRTGTRTPAGGAR